MMMKIGKNETKQILLLNGSVLLMIFIYFSASLYYHLPLSYGTDIRTELWEFYTEFRNLMLIFFKTGQFPFYSWSTFLGNNFWASKSFYITGDPYNYLGLLYKGQYFDLARLLTGLKFIVAANGFYLLLSEMDFRPETKVIISLAYAFSGWAVFFSGQTMFLSFYSFVPFYLCGIERYLNNGRWLLFALNCAVLFSTNYYLFYALSILTILYFSYRYAMRGMDRRKFWPSALKLVLFDILGSCITSFVWLPGALYILGSGRFRSNISFFYRPLDYLNLLYSAFVPNHLYIYRNNILETGAHYTREICLYSSVLLIVLLPQYFRIADKKSSRNTGILYGILGLILVLPKISSALQGFGDPSYRWVFFLVIMNLETIAYVLDHRSELSMPLLRNTCLICSSGLAVIFILAMVLTKSSISDYLPHLALTVIFMALILLAPWIYRQKHSFFLLGMVFTELAVSGFWTYANDARGVKRTEDYTYLYRVTHVLETYPGELENEICSIDDEAATSFYRTYIPLNGIYWDYSNNMSIFYGLQGLMTYDSTFAPSFLDLYDLVPDVNQYDSDWIFNIEDANLMTYLNTRYAIVQSSDVMDSEQWELIDENYLGYLNIYRNRNYRPLGTSYSKWKSSEDYKADGNTSDFLDTVIIDTKETDVNKVIPYLSNAKAYTYNTIHKNNMLTSDYYSDQDGYMILTIPYDKGWKILVDDTEVEYERVGGGFIGLRVQAGTHHISMYFRPVGFRTGLILSGFSILAVVASVMIQKKKAKAKGKDSTAKTDC